ncbi:MAG: ferrochelatase [Verrucomicrobia bacterium]|nr:ferrochelatase [Verrucomicrobiota bacterium]
MNKSAVLMLAYGSPEDLADMRAYLLDIRGGRETPQELVDEITERYRVVGGSPLNKWTKEQAEALSSELKKRSVDSSVFVGMRHWHPKIETVVRQMADDGITNALAIVMAPHYSSMSVSRYMGAVDNANKALGSPITFGFVTSWWKQARFFDALEMKIRKGLALFRADGSGRRLKVIFTAHSLPARILKGGDPYDADLKDNAHQIAERVGHIDWMFAYQSAGASREQWLGPAIEDVIPELAEQGCTDILVAPIGFVCDHIEILYDLDIEAKQIAEEHGIRLERTESMNTTPLFIEAVADALIHSAI